MAQRPKSGANQEVRQLVKAIRLALRARYHEGAWAFVPELSTTTGQAPATFLDAWAMTLTPSSGFTRAAFEIKISRADFLKELRQPNKRRNALRFSNLFYFVTPLGVVRDGELPADAGHLEFVAGDLRVAVEAPHRDGSSASWPFVASLLRRALGLRSGRAAAVRHRRGGLRADAEDERFRLGTGSVGSRPQG